MKRKRGSLLLMKKPTKFNAILFRPLPLEPMKWAVDPGTVAFDEPWVRFTTTEGKRVSIIPSHNDTFIVEEVTDVEAMRRGKR